MLFRHGDYRSFMSEVLSERIKQNPSYSLRLFAMELSLSPSTLSEILSRKKNLSFGRAAEVAGKLGLNEEERDYFCALAQLASAKRPDEKRQVLERLAHRHPTMPAANLGTELFSLISDWYYVPILALVDVDSFSFTPRNVARKLGITPLEAQVAIERLLRFELIREVSKNRYARTHEQMRFESREANQALRNFHEQMLNKVIEALSTQSNEEKLMETRTLAIDPTLLPAVRQKVNRFLEDLVSFLDRGKKTEVYHLSLGFIHVQGGKKNAKDRARVGH